MAQACTHASTAACGPHCEGWPCWCLLISWAGRPGCAAADAGRHSLAIHQVHRGWGGQCSGIGGVGGSRGQKDDHRCRGSWLAQHTCCAARHLCQQSAQRSAAACIYIFAWAACCEDACPCSRCTAFASAHTGEHAPEHRYCPAAQGETTLTSREIVAFKPAAKSR